MEYIDWRGFKVHPDNVPMARPGIYEFRCLINGKPYIGITGVKTGIAGRCWSSFRGHGGPKFTRAIRKYGTGSFVLTPLFYAIDEVDRTWLLNLEANLIAENDSVKNGYNVQEASHVGPCGEEFSAIMREVLARPEVKVKISIGLRAALAFPELRIKWSEVARLAAARPGAKEKRSKAARVAHLKPEMKIKHSAGLSKAWARPGEKQRRRITQCEAQSRPEVNEKRSVSLRRTNLQPDVKARRSAAKRADEARKTPEQRSEQANKAWVSRRINIANSTTGEQLGDCIRLAHAADPTIAQRMRISIKAGHARRTPEQKKSAAEKTWATRRANAAKRVRENQSD